MNTILTYAVPVYEEGFIRKNPYDVEVYVSWSSFWETLILNMRTTTVSFAIHKKKCNNVEKQNILKKIKELEETVQDIPNQERVVNLEAANERLEQIRKNKIEGIMIRSRAKWQEQGERSTAYFLSLEKRAYSDKLIGSLEDGEGGLITSQDQIIRKLVDYYAEMFKKRPMNLSLTDQFIGEVNIKQISNNDKTFLSTSLTLADIEEALKKMSKNRNPGSDGFSMEFYQHFWNDFKLHFLRMMNESIETRTLPLTLREGILTLVPKPNRPRSEIKLYRPITLLNVSYKIIASAVANKIRTVLPAVIDKDQTGFMKGRFIGDNTRLTYDLMQEVKNDREKLA